MALAKSQALAMLALSLMLLLGMVWAVVWAERRLREQAEQWRRDERQRQMDAIARGHPFISNPDPYRGIGHASPSRVLPGSRRVRVIRTATRMLLHIFFRVVRGG